MKVLLNGGRGGHTLERMNPPQEKQNPLVVEKEEEEEERGGGVMFMVYDLQGEPRMFRFFCVVQIPESPVPSRGMLMTSSPAMQSCLCPLSRLQRRPPWSRGKATKSTTILCSGPRTEAGRHTGGAAGRELVQVLARGRGGADRGGGGAGGGVL